MSVHPVNASRGNFAVIFVSKRTGPDPDYDAMNTLLAEAAKSIPGFISEIALRNEHGMGIAVSYWETKEAIEQWKHHADHLLAKQKGKEDWYEWYSIYITEIGYAHQFIAAL